MEDIGTATETLAGTIDTQMTNMKTYIQGLMNKVEEWRKAHISAIDEIIRKNEELNGIENNKLTEPPKAEETQKEEEPKVETPKTEPPKEEIKREKPVRINKRQYIPKYSDQKKKPFYEENDEISANTGDYQEV